MRKCGKFAAICCMLGVLLTGCGESGAPDTEEKSTLIIDKNGGVAYHLVEEFAEDYYELSELETMASEEAANFNKTKQNEEKKPVNVEKVELLANDPKKVTVQYSFRDVGCFSEFTGSALFYSTVSEAMSRGYRIEATLNSVADDIALTEELLQSHGDSRIVITDIKTTIVCPFKVTHLSEGVSLREDGSVDTTGAEGIVYILLKK